MMAKWHHAPGPWAGEDSTLPALGHMGGVRSGGPCWRNGTRDPWEGTDVHPERCVAIRTRGSGGITGSDCQHRGWEHWAGSEMLWQICVRSCA